MLILRQAQDRRHRAERTKPFGLTVHSPAGGVLSSPKGALLSQRGGSAHARQAKTADCGKTLAGQLRRGMKCHGYEAATPLSGVLEPDSSGGSDFIAVLPRQARHHP